MKEIELSEKEANVVNDNGQEIPHTQEFVDGGFTLDVSYKGNIDCSMIIRRGSPVSAMKLFLDFL